MRRAPERNGSACRTVGLAAAADQAPPVAMLVASAGNAGPAAHVRDTGCEGLREALLRHVTALGELCELVTGHEDMTECGCGRFDDWFQTWDGPAQRLHVPDDLLEQARAALAASREEEG